MVCDICQKRTAIVFAYKTEEVELPEGQTQVESENVDPTSERGLCAACASGLEPVDVDEARREIAALSDRKDDFAHYDRAFLADRLLGCAAANDQSLPADLLAFAQQHAPPSA